MAMICKDTLMMELVCRIWDISIMKFNEFATEYDKLVKQNDDSILIDGKGSISKTLLEYNLPPYRNSPLFKTKEDALDYLSKSINFPKLNNTKQRYVIEKICENEDMNRYCDEIHIYIYEMTPISLIEYIGKQMKFKPNVIADLQNKYNNISESIYEINQIFNTDKIELYIDE